MERSDSIAELAKALSMFQGELRPAKKDSENPFFHATFADLTSVYEAVREPLAKNGLSVTQTLGNEESVLIVETTLLHSSGEWISSKLGVPLSKTDPQSIGSAISYARRYSLSAILGVSAEDDDAEAATEHGQGGKAAEQMSKPTQQKATPQTAQAKEHWCSIHNIAFHEFKGKDGKSHWWSHKTDDGWCNEDKQKKSESEPKATAPTSKPVEAPPTKEELEGALAKVEQSQAEKDFDKMQSAGTEPIDMAWLKESLETIQWTDVGKWIRSHCKNIASFTKVSEAVHLMSIPQRAEFVAEVERRLEEGGA